MKTLRGLPGTRPRGERGVVTAETAMMLPVLVFVTVALAWLVTLGVAQVRVVDAARETARALARDEPRDEALALGRRAAPDGARITTGQDGDAVVVQVAAPVDPAWGLLGFLPSFDVTADATVAVEDR